MTLLINFKKTSKIQNSVIQQVKEWKDAKQIKMYYEYKKLPQFIYAFIGKILQKNKN